MIRSILRALVAVCLAFSLHARVATAQERPEAESRALECASMGFGSQAGTVFQLFVCSDGTLIAKPRHDLKVPPVPKGRRLPDEVSL